MAEAVSLLGFIPHRDRTIEQEEAHERAEKVVLKFALPPVRLARGEKVRLFDFWKHPDVVADVGLPFDRVHQQTGSCLPPQAPVRMADGTELAISEIKVGDRVASHTGLSRRVLGVRAKPTGEQMRSIRLRGWADRLHCTDGHNLPVWSGSQIVWTAASKVLPGDLLLVGYGVTETKEHVIDVLDYVRGCDLSQIGHYRQSKGRDASPTHRRTSALASTAEKRGLLGRKLVTVKGGRLANAIPRTVAVTSAFARWVGLYLAEGCASDHRVSFTLSKDEGTLAEEIVQLTRGIWGLEARVQKSKSRPGSLQVRIPSLTLVKFVKSFLPGLAATKRVPGLFFSSSRAVRLALIGGWMDGDGYAKKLPREFRITGVSGSRGMIRDFGQLAMSCGIPSATINRKPRGITKESGAFSMWPAMARDVPSTKIQAMPADVVCREKSRRMTPFGMARRVMDNKALGVAEGLVYDIEVEHDHTFQAWGVVVHNCVWAGGTSALFSTIAAQRLADDSPTKAFLPFTLHNYLMSRYNLGLTTPGEGSAGSTFAQSLTLNGCRDWPNGVPDGLPDWTDTDGIEVKAADEYLWSSPANNPYYKKVLDDAKGNLLGSAGLCKDVGQLRSYVANGYGVSFACDNFIGRAQVEGEGDEACVIGYWDQPGGHQQSVHAYWEHPRFGPLYWAQNNWPRSVYPHDPAGGPVCGCWVREDKVQSAIQNLHSEVYGLSHQKWIPARPKMLDWYA